MNKQILCGFVSVLGFVGYSQADVQVSPFRLEETRSIAFKHDDVGRQADGLKLELSLKGPELVDAVRYGGMNIDKAVDDLGTNLIPKKDPFMQGHKLEEFANAFFRKSEVEQKRAVDDPQVDIRLAVPKRSAKKIVELRGSFEISQPGTIKTIETPDIAKAGTKNLAIPEAAGVTITATVKATNKMSIDLEIKGKEDAVDSIEVVDATGKKISNGMSSWSFGNGPAHKSLNLNSSLDDTMKLVVKLELDRKTTKVPFDLKNIALP